MTKWRDPYLAGWNDAISMAVEAYEMASKNHEVAARRAGSEEERNNLRNLAAHEAMRAMVISSMKKPEDV